MRVFADRVQETTTTTGTGALTLAGAVAKFRAFSDVCANGDTVYYAIVHQTANEWEVGVGTWSTGGSLTRTTVRSSSNSGSAVSFSAGTKDVMLVLPANALRRRTIELSIQVDSGAVPTGAAKYTRPVSIAGTLVGWRLTADIATTAILDVWKANGAIPTNSNSIVASAKPALSSASVANSSTLTGWTTAVAVGDVFRLEIEANSSAAALTLTLELDVD